jgi:hypothetical protein
MSDSSTAGTVGQLNTAIEAANALVANSGTYTITLTSNITLASLATGINPLDAIDLNTGVVLDIVGTNGSGSYALIGAGTQGPVRGLFVYAGTVDVTNLLIENMDAQGGRGGSEAGGGAGLGGGLFVGSNVAGDAGNVTLNNVSFSGNRATGGSGAAGGAQAGGGGGLGGNGANGAGNARSKGGGGGGLGAGVSGGAPGQGGAAGIVSGGAAAGKGGSGGGTGGAEGGGGGGGGPSTYGGGAGGGGGVSGGNGGSASLTSRGPGGGGGGFGGGGGGGGAGIVIGGGGGKGGFGGGGGAGSGIFSRTGGKGGQGGFGGGGGGGGAEGIGSRNGGGGAGGFGGGNAGNNSSGGGGGLGAGGDIFVQAGASLTIEGNATTSLADGTVTGGSTVLGNQTLSQPGQAFGPGIYLQGTLGVLTFNSNGTTETIAASITDDKGAATAKGYGGASGYTEGSTGIVKDGAGTVILTGTNTYTGGTAIDAGTLNVASVASIGTGAVTFGAATATLAFATAPASGSTFADPLIGFASAGTIDLPNLAFTANATVTVFGTIVTLTDGGATENFTLASPTTTPIFALADSGTGTQLSSILPTTVTSVGVLNDAIAAANAMAANSGTDTITITSNITLGTTALTAIDLAAGNTLDIVGTNGASSFALVGGGAATPERGLFVYAGTVSIQNLTIENMDAQGGNGGSAGGGGAGLGGGLFISSNVAGDAGNVILSNVSFAGDRAVGGGGGANASGLTGAGGGGGGLAGNGGNRGSGNATPGAGGAGIDGFGTGGGGGGFFGGSGANGGFGGGGGGGFRGSSTNLAGGTGGFGGGGGGQRGFGFGFGGGQGGFGGGAGAAGNRHTGGGGLAAGGDIFVQGGASLTIEGNAATTIADGTVVAGTGATAGQAFGSGIYLQGTNGVLTFDSNGTIETITAPITDDQGAAAAAVPPYGGAPGYTPGSTGIEITGAGTVILTGTNTYTGGTTIEAGALQIASVANIGTGDVTFGGFGATLAFSTTPTSGSTFADKLTDFTVGGTVDLQQLAFTPGATAVVAGTTLTLTDGGTIENFVLSSAPAPGTPLDVYAAGAGTAFSFQSASVANIADLNSAIEAADSLVASSGTYTITLTGDVTLGATALATIDLAAGDTLDIVGTNGASSFALIGGSTTTPERGLFVTAGAVSIQDLMIENMAAKGGNGAVDGGGAAGLGGGLFVGSEVAGDAGNVTLNNVSFSGDSATGGNGGAVGLGSGGGGGLGGNSGAAPFVGSGGNGGVGIGSGTNGGGAGGTGAFGGGVGGKGGVGFGGGGGGGSGGDTGGNGGFGGFGGGGGAGGGFLGTGGGGGGKGGPGGIFGGGGGGGGATGGFGGGGGGTGGFGAGNGAGNGGGGGGGLAAGGDIFVQGGASLTIAGTTSTSIATGTVTQGAAGGSGAGGGQFFGDGIYLQGTLGVLTFDSNGTTETIAAPITDDQGAAAAAGYGGVGNYTEGSTGIVKTGAGTVVLSAANTYTGGTTIDAGTVDLAAGGSAGSGAISFGATTSDLKIDAAIVNGSTFADALTGFATGGTVDLTGLTYVSGATANLLNNTVTVTAGGVTEDFKLSGSPAAGTPFYAFSDGSAGGTEVSSLCFLDGTQIATPAGEVAVERLAAGDMVMTVSGKARRVVWIGTGRVLATRGRRNAATPVIVRKGALADNVPHIDLRVTKGHSLYLDGVLIPVEFLVNHRTILWDDHAQEVSLFHIELETHDVILANGAPAETYRDDGNRWLFRNANAGWDLPPQEPCAPVLTGGPVVDAIWRRLLDRDGARPGVPVTDDADLHLLMDGQRLDAAHRVGEAYIFQVAAVPSDLRIGSRAAAPAELGLARDPRVLGVALRDLVVRKGTRFQAIHAKDERLGDGFHAFEPAEGFRWTDGDATIPASLFAGLTGPFEVVLHIGATTWYCADGWVRRAA